MVTLFLVFYGTAILFSIVAVLICSHTISVRRVSFSSHPCPEFIVCRILMMTSVRWLIPQCSFDLHFSNNEWFEPPFMYLLPALCFLWRNVYLGLPLIASKGFPHNQVCFLITHTPRHPHLQPSCGSLLPVTKLPHCFGDEGQPPWPGCRGLPGKTCACCLLLTDALICCTAASLSSSRQWLCSLLPPGPCQSRPLPSHAPHLLPAPLHFITPTHAPDSRLDATSAGRSSLTSKSQWPPVWWAPRARVPTSEPGLESESPGLSPGGTACLLCDLGWLTV